MEYQMELPKVLHRCATSENPFWQYCTVGAMFSNCVNRFGFDPKSLVDSIKQDEIAWNEFTKIAMAFVYIMAQKHVKAYGFYTDGRNKFAAEECWKLTFVHDEIESVAQKMASDLHLRVQDMVYDVAGILNADMANQHRESLALVPAAQLAFGHPTIQQSFAQACVLALFYRYGQDECIKNKDYLFPLI